MESGPSMKCAAPASPIQTHREQGVPGASPAARFRHGRVGIARPSAFGLRHIGRVVKPEELRPQPAQPQAHERWRR
jgi:hypothetical protein